MMRVVNNNIIMIGIYIAPFPFIRCSKALHSVIVLQIPDDEGISADP